MPAASRAATTWLTEWTGPELPDPPPQATSAAISAAHPSAFIRILPQLGSGLRPEPRRSHGPCVLLPRAAHTVAAAAQSETRRVAINRCAGTNDAPIDCQGSCWWLPADQ